MSHAKLDHALRYIVQNTRSSGGATEKEKPTRPVPDRADLVEHYFSTPELARHVAREGKLDVVVTTNDAATAIQHIERLGGEAKARPNARVFAARVPAMHVLEACSHKSILRMRLAVETEQSLDRANLHSNLTNDAGERYYPTDLGEGVLVGVIDSGIDVAHPAFTDPDKGCRIVAYWDQTNGEKYGDGHKPIADAAKTSPDTNGHGTAVASCAAGNGRGSPDGVMFGVAPQAKIAVVKTTMSDPDLITAIDWLCEIADSLGLPLVINMSLGGHSDGHDGYDEVSQHIDLISDEGRIVVVAGGNQGEYDIHAMHDFDVHNPLWRYAFQPVLTPTTADPNVRKGTITVTIYGNRDDNLELLLQDPRGVGYKAPTSISSQVPLDSPGYRGYWDKDRQQLSGDIFYTIKLIIETDDKFFRGAWTIQAKLRDGGKLGESTRVHSWVTSTRQGLFTSGASRAYLVGSPGASRAAITAGAYISRNEWVDSSAKIFQADGLRIGELAAFSSPGPSRTGLIKPDLCAPGQWVGMARSNRAPVNPTYQIGTSPYAVNAGTSFASPYIAGAVALLLQINPNVGPDEAKLLLQGTSTPKQPTTSWGFGKLDCKRLLREANLLLRPAKRATGS